jgi:alpha-galactosidase
MTRRTFLFLPAVARDPAPGVRVLRRWHGPFCTLRLQNRSRAHQRVREVIVWELDRRVAPETPLYAEGFQMLSQTGGTLGKPEPIGAYTDVKHYRLPEPAGAFTAYNLVHVGNLLLAFTSCRRFSGKFHLRPSSIEASLDLEGLEIAPGQTIDLEEMAVFEGHDHGALFEKLAARLGANHPPILPAEAPQGWCSWYCFGPTVTAQQVMENLEFIAGRMPALRYIQIDDGYQAAMGDWLETGKAFGGDVRAVLRQIRQRGFEPAIWVAPFIAEARSRVFQEHPGWFMKDDQNQPLASNRVTFGGWRMGPWYALDGTHPEVQRHLENVFRTMRQEWGVTYFKLDANYWGAMPGGRLHDPRATRIEAYRRGMEAVRRGSGDAFLLGCNHPLWPSLGLIHGSRSSNDIARRWPRFRQVARENLRRGWQNGRLWWNDPDVVLLSGDLTEHEFLFHAASIYASGGMLLAGDDLPRLAPARLEMLRKLSPPTGRAAVFDSALRIGRLRQPHRELIFFLNWNDQAESFEARVPPGAVVKDFWSGAEVASRIPNVPPRSARILVCTEPRP